MKRDPERIGYLVRRRFLALQFEHEDKAMAAKKLAEIHERDCDEKLAVTYREMQEAEERIAAECSKLVATLK